MILSGWKEIAQFLGKSVRTIQRWHYDKRYKKPLPLLKSSPCKGGRITTSQYIVLQWIQELSTLPSYSPHKYKREYHPNQDKRKDK